MIVDGVDFGIVGAQQIAAQLQIVGWIGEHQVAGTVRELPQLFKAIAQDDGVDGNGHTRLADS
jgi:hypothetical protein